MAASAPPKKLVQQELFRGAYSAPALPPVADVPAGIGTLPRDIYIAWRALQTRGPMTTAELDRWLFREQDWSHVRAERAARDIARCGYVIVDSSGALSAREETR